MLAGLPAPPEVSRAEAEASFDPMRMSFLAESRIVDTTRIREILGFTPRYGNAEDGIRASLQAEKDLDQS
jgi:nucleoside-diphosphate-sugar epimerase